MFETGQGHSYEYMPKRFCVVYCYYLFYFILFSDTLSFFDASCKSAVKNKIVIKRNIAMLSS